jgi:hypothetical protein
MRLGRIGELVVGVVLILSARPLPELADFLRRARAQIDPAPPGSPPTSGCAGFPGLRREEVARLAGVTSRSRTPESTKPVPSVANTEYATK